MNSIRKTSDLGHFEVKEGGKNYLHFNTAQLDLALEADRPKAPQILSGWAIEPDGRPYAPHPYRIHNLAHGYRIAPPFSGSEAIRAIEILGAASKHRDPVAANNRVESAWSAIVGGAN